MNTRGLVSHLVVGVSALAAGVALTWLVSSRPAPLDPVTTHGEWVYAKKPTGDSVRAYVAYPERKDKAPAMIVIHEIFGLTEWEPTVADRLAGKGYLAIAPDFLSSRFGQTPDSGGRQLMAQLTAEGITADLDAVYSYVNGLPSVRPDRVGVIGFCWGGGQTFRYATNNPKLKAAVVCYGPNPDTTHLSRVTAPVLGVYGENDNRINSMLPAVSRIMTALGKSFVADSYPGTGHGFLKPGRRGYDTDQPDKAWAKIEKFLKDNLDQ
jgi:carboxymethylenebutenolidase